MLQVWKEPLSKKMHQKNVKCPNCEGYHNAFSNKCPLRFREKKTNTVAWERTISRAIEKGFKNFEEQLAEKVTDRLNGFRYDFRFKKQIHKIKSNYKLISTDVTDRRGSGVAVLIKNELKYNIVEIERINYEVELIVYEIKLKYEWLRIINVYIHPNAKIEHVIEIEKYLNKSSTIIVGDINAHHKTWSQGKPNTRGVTIKNMLDRQNMKICNKKESFF